MVKITKVEPESVPFVKDDSPVAYRFTPPTPGEFYPGLPDRDLTAEDVAKLDPDALALAVKVKFYAKTSA